MPVALFPQVTACNLDSSLPGCSHLHPLRQGCCGTAPPGRIPIRIDIPPIASRRPEGGPTGDYLPNQIGDVLKDQVDLSGFKISTGVVAFRTNRPIPVEFRIKEGFSDRCTMSWFGHSISAVGVVFVKDLFGQHPTASLEYSTDNLLAVRSAFGCPASSTYFTLPFEMMPLDPNRSVNQPAFISLPVRGKSVRTYLTR